MFSNIDSSLLQHILKKTSHPGLEKNDHTVSLKLLSVMIIHNNVCIFARSGEKRDMVDYFNGGDVDSLHKLRWE